MGFDQVLGPPQPDISENLKQDYLKKIKYKILYDVPQIKGIMSG